MHREPMRIVSLHLAMLTLPFRWQFRHAAASRRSNETLFVAVRTNNGSFGYGECIPRPYLTGETIPGCIRYIRDFLEPRLRELHVHRDMRPDEMLRPLYLASDAQGALAAYGALDMAVFDAWARHFQIPGQSMLGETRWGNPGAYPLTAPIGLGMPAFLTPRLFRAMGFSRFKLKIEGTLAGARGATPEGRISLSRDLTRLAQVRRAVGQDALIVLDANGSLHGADAGSGDNVLTQIAQFRAHGIAALEEPLQARDFDTLVRLERTTGVPLMLDESLCTQRDAAAVRAAGGVALWNLRLAKNGGFTGVLALAAEAKAQGVGIQIGALVGESSLLSAATATILPRLDPLFVESSFPSWLLQGDPFTGGPVTGPELRPRRGVLGLGVEPCRATLTALGIKSAAL